LALQDAIPDLWCASMNMVDADRNEIANESETVVVALTRADKFRSRFLRAKALCSRLSDDSVRTVVGQALRECHGYQDDYFNPEVPDPGVEEWRRTNQTVD
jgi:hypothetical protein